MSGFDMGQLLRQVVNPRAAGLTGREAERRQIDREQYLLELQHRGQSVELESQYTVSRVITDLHRLGSDSGTSIVFPIGATHGDEIESVAITFLDIVDGEVFAAATTVLESVLAPLDSNAYPAALGYSGI